MYYGFFDALPSIVAKEKARTVRNLDNKYDSWDRKIDEYEQRQALSSCGHSCTVI